MKIEEELFKLYRVDKEKLIKYGFQKEKEDYVFTKNFMNNTFKAIIKVNKDNKVQGTVWDLEAECEYTSFRIENITGEFVNKVKEAYQNILKDIRKNCFDKNYFIYNQSNEIASLIIKKYNVYPEFLWNKFPSYGVFRSSNTEKWFSIIMNIDKSKIVPSESCEIEILNVKLDDLTKDYLKQKGIYPAYHLNKKNWVTITLDGTLKNDEIMSLVDISYALAHKKDSWIIPANPNFFDVISYIESLKVFSWKQPKNINLNDTVYIYLGAPFSALLYKCKVIELDLYNEPKRPVMNLYLIKKYDKEKYTFKKLKKYGLNSVRSARRIPLKLAQELDKDN